jgi:colanic acid/amylovoran biosynthesis glycosyltransferase
VRLAYLVSRFPSFSETFVLRELDAVAAEDDLELQLRSLFPPPGEPVHPAAEAWVPRVRRPGPAAGAAAFGRWLVRRPLRLLSSVGIVVAAYARLPRKLARALVTIPLACAHARELQDENVEHVHAHFATYPALAAWVAWRLTGIPYSFTAHAHDIFIHQAMLARKASDAAFVVAISEFHRDFLRERAPAARLELVHCGVNPQRFAAAAAPRMPASGPVRALCVAGLREYKGHSVLLRAIAAEPLDRLELELVGDGELRGPLEELVADLGLGSRVRFVGWVAEPEVERRLAEADLFVLPSIVAPDGDMEGLPVALMEALAAGLPTVATRQAGIPELVREGETGWLAEPGDVEDLRRALAAAIASPEQAAERGHAGRQLVEREFDQARSASRLAELFRSRTLAP